MARDEIFTIWKPLFGIFPPSCVTTCVSLYDLYTMQLLYFSITSSKEKKIPSGTAVLETSRTHSNIVSSYRQLSPLILAEVVDLGSDNIGGSYQSPAAFSRNADERVRGVC